MAKFPVQYKIFIHATGAVSCYKVSDFEANILFSVILQNVLICSTIFSGLIDVPTNPKQFKFYSYYTDLHLLNQRSKLTKHLHNVIFRLQTSSHSGVVSFKLNGAKNRQAEWWCSNNSKYATVLPWKLHSAALPYASKYGLIRLEKVHIFVLYVDLTC